MQKLWICVLVLCAACGPKARDEGGGDDDDGVPDVCPRCSADNQSVIDCNGVETPCPLDMACSEGACLNACQAAEENHSSVGCEYYAVDMDAAQGPPQDACYTVFVANTSREQAHMTVEWNGAQIDLGKFAKLPVGTGQSLAYGTYDPNVGLAPGQVAIIFLAYAPALMNVACPVPAAIGTAAQIPGTGTGFAFHLTTDLPVVAYQMLPYGGGAAAATGASLLLPTSAWGDNYVAVSAYDGPAPPIPVAQGPSYNIVAKEDATTVTMRPKSNITAGGGLPAGMANQPYTFTLNKGQYAQITQMSPLSGSPISADKPIGVFGGHQIMSIDRCCGDHGEQMLAPVRALGSEYVAAPHPDRRATPEPRLYRIFGAVDGTQLTYEPPNVGPAIVNLGEYHEIRTNAPFVVRSQDTSHPFAMFTYMTGAGDETSDGNGDPDFVRLVPPLQYLSHYVFFTDPTYPFTYLTVVRKRHEGEFRDVDLKCLGTISGWQPVGASPDYEIAFVRLVDHWAGTSTCNNGVQEMNSVGPFGVWVWGWGSGDTNTGWVSYGYPAGEGVLPINDVVIY
ncbi:MAG TPA: IgGFc-binding protein [Kofleriaceae bacterium]|nr:IgGFc-binding protein [Kofleriaceae bacterium]